MSVSFAGIMLSDARGEGLLSADIMATATPRVLDGVCPPASVCKSVTIDGVEIQLAIWRDDSGRHISATRRLDGGMLIVAAAQGLGSGESTAPLDGKRAGSRIKPPLATLPFTTEQLAALAANPAMLQFP